MVELAKAAFPRLIVVLLVDDLTQSHELGVINANQVVFRLIVGGTLEISLGGEVPASTAIVECRLKATILGGPTSCGIVALGLVEKGVIRAKSVFVSIRTMWDNSAWV